MEFLEGSTKLLSEKFTEKSYCFESELTFTAEFNLHMLLWSEHADFHGSRSFLNIDFFKYLFCSITNENES